VKPHPIDLLALFFGAAFVMAGACFFLNETAGTDVNLAWVSAAGFIAVGAIALIATVLRNQGAPRDDGSEVEVVEG